MPPNTSLSGPYYLSLQSTCSTCHSNCCCLFYVNRIYQRGRCQVKLELKWRQMPIRFELLHRYFNSVSPGQLLFNSVFQSLKTTHNTYIFSNDPPTLTVGYRLPASVVTINVHQSSLLMTAIMFVSHLSQITLNQRKE